MYLGNLVDVGLTDRQGRRQADDGMPEVLWSDPLSQGVDADKLQLRNLLRLQVRTAWRAIGNVARWGIGAVVGSILIFLGVLSEWSTTSVIALTAWAVALLWASAKFTRLVVVDSQSN